VKVPKHIDPESREALNMMRKISRVIGLELFFGFRRHDFVQNLLGLFRVVGLNVHCLQGAMYPDSRRLARNHVQIGRIVMNDVPQVLVNLAHAGFLRSLALPRYL
jgi:hypothetical protein